MGSELLRVSGVRCSRCGGCCTCVCGRQPLKSLPLSTAFCRKKRRAGEEGYLAGPEEGDDAAIVRRNTAFWGLKQSNYFVEGNHFVADSYYRLSRKSHGFGCVFDIGAVEIWR